MAGEMLGLSTGLSVTISESIRASIRGICFAFSKAETGGRALRESLSMAEGCVQAATTSPG
jgi:hypothetical protein